jgi:hypothetical protein
MTDRRGNQIYCGRFFRHGDQLEIERQR